MLTVYVSPGASPKLVADVQRLEPAVRTRVKARGRHTDSCDANAEEWAAALKSAGYAAEAHEDGLAVLETPVFHADTGEVRDSIGHDWCVVDENGTTVIVDGSIRQFKGQIPKYVDSFWGEALGEADVHPAIRSEYWITPEGLLNADDDGDMNHEGHVVEAVINNICHFLGNEWDMGPDGAAFRQMLNDEVFVERYGEDEEDPYGRLRAELVAARVFRSEAEAEAALQTFSGQETDARVFAINYWKWIRVAGANIEVPDFDPRTLRRAGEGLADILFEESGVDDMEVINAVVVRVSTYSGRRALGSGRREATVGELIAGDAGGGNTELDDIAKSGGDAVRKMDAATASPFYRGKLGDSLAALIAGTPARQVIETLDSRRALKCWIDRSGNVVPIGRFTHSEWAEHRTGSKDGYDDLLAAGWVRLSNQFEGRGLFHSGLPINPAQRRTLEELCLTYDMSLDDLSFGRRKVFYEPPVQHAGA